MAKAAKATKAGKAATGRPKVFQNEMFQTALRLPVACNERADDLIEFVSTTLSLGGKRVVRSDVLREAILRGLNSLEAERAGLVQPTRGQARR